MRPGLRRLLILAALLAGHPSPAQTPQDSARMRGIQAFEQGDLAGAAVHFTEAAAQGDRAAQFNLGVMHENGLGVPRNAVEAARQYRLAADQGHAKAQARLASLLWRGAAVPPNPREAFRLASLAADQREPEGFGVLGILYFNGQGAPRNMIEAWYWLALTERHHPDPGQREWARTSRMRAANSLSAAQLALLRDRVDAYRMP